MALKRLDKIAETKPVTAREERPSLVIKSDDVVRFNGAVSDVKDAQAIVDELRIKILGQGVPFLYGHNITHPGATVKTVEVIDKTGAAVRLTSQAKYSAANPDAAEALFENLGLKHPEAKIDINNFVQEAVTASFDSKIFNDAEGRFNEKVYSAYAAAVLKVTNDLIAKGVLQTGTVSPLKTTKKVLPLESFDDKRWTTFPDVRDQESIREVLPNTITLTPVK
jgi:hypothetical protein